VLQRIRLGDDLPPIMGDRVQLQQVILNLVINAIQAMSAVSEGPRELSISSEKVTAIPGPANAAERERSAPDGSSSAKAMEDKSASVRAVGLEPERQTPNAERQTRNAYVLVSVASAFLLAAHVWATDEPIHITVISKDPDNHFWTAMVEGAKEAAKGQNVQITAAGRVPASFSPPTCRLSSSKLRSLDHWQWARRSSS
jgi:hypothetical protein